MSSYVYIIRAGEKGNSPIKIGVSDNPERRVSDLQTGNPKKLYLLCSIEYKTRKEAFTAESRFHEMMGHRGLIGEWFSPKKNGYIKSIMSHAESGDDKIKAKRNDELESYSRIKRQNKSLLKKIKHLERLLSDKQIVRDRNKKEKKALLDLLNENGVYFNEINKILKNARK